MNDFDYDVMQKKRIAAGDRHRKRGSRSQKCPLPSDGLSNAQLSRMSGPVRSYQLGQPMSWRTFLEMPEDLQRQYLERLRTKYKATNEMIGAMLHISPTSVSIRQKELGITAEHPHLTDDDKLRRIREWQSFLHGADTTETQTVEPDEPDEPDVSHEESQPTPGRKRTAPLELGAISAEFNGIFDPSSLASWLTAFPIHGTPKVRIRVEVALLEGGEADEVPAHAAPADRH